MAILKICEIGNDSDSILKENVTLLGKLMARLIHNEIDRASEILQELAFDDLECLERAGRDLSLLVPIIKGD